MDHMLSSADVGVWKRQKNTKKNMSTSLCASPALPYRTFLPTFSSSLHTDILFEEGPRHTEKENFCIRARGGTVTSTLS